LLEGVNCLRSNVYQQPFRAVDFSSFTDSFIFTIQSAVLCDFQHSRTLTKVFFIPASKIMQKVWQVYDVKFPWYTAAEMRWWCLTDLTEFDVWENRHYFLIKMVLLRPILICLLNKYYIFWLCVCSLSYPACSAHAPCYIPVIPLNVPHFPTLSYKRHDFRGKKLLNIKCVLISSTAFIWNISRSKKNSATFYKCTWMFM